MDGSNHETYHAASRAGVLDRAWSVGPLLVAARGRIEEERGLPADVIAALHGARLFRLLLPRSLGGDELDLATQAEVIETIARHDASTAWVMSQGAGCAMAAAYLSPAAGIRLFGPADAVLAWGAGLQGKAVICDGGYRVTGKWTFASGSRHATLLGGHSYVFNADGTPVMRADGRQLDRTALFARSKAKVHDVWRVVGLKGTGSDTFEVHDLFVPSDETVDREEPAERTEPGTLYKFSASLAYGAGFAGLMLGIARGMVDDMTALAKTKTQRGASMSMRESPVFQTQLSLIEAKLRAIRAYHLSTLADTWRTVQETGDLTLAQRADLKLASTYTINTAFEVVTEAYRASGQHAIFPENHFEQRMRDAMTASQQTQGRPTNYITVGRVMLGLPPDSTMFL